MNELFFLLHIITVALFSLWALYIGKNALIVLVAIQSVLANLFVVKQMTFLGFNVTCADVFAVGTILALNLLQEYFGQGATKKAIWLSFFAMFFYLVMSQIHLLYLPSIHDFSHNMFLGILKFMPRIIGTSFIVFYITRFLNMYLYAFLQNRFGKQYMVLRNFISITSIQLLDTILFTVLALYGVAGSLLQIIVMSFFIKVVVIFLTTPFVVFSKKIVKIGKQQ